MGHETQILIACDPSSIEKIVIDGIPIVGVLGMITYLHLYKYSYKMMYRSSTIKTQPCSKIASTCVMFLKALDILAGKRHFQ